MLKLEKGRPVDCTGRLEKEIRTYDFLDKLNIEYERIDHEELNTMAACEEVDKLLGATICKNLFLCNMQDYTAPYIRNVTYRRHDGRSKNKRINAAEIYRRQEIH